MASTFLESAQKRIRAWLFELRVAERYVYPPSTVDRATWMLDNARRATRHEMPDWSPVEVERLARQRAMAALRDLAHWRAVRCQKL